MWTEMLETFCIIFVIAMVLALGIPPSLKKVLTSIEDNSILRM